MKERPILFSAATVRAILSNTKTQTRRVIKPQHLAFFNQDAAAMLSDWNERPLPYGKPGDRLWVRETWHDASSSLHSCALYRADGTDLHWDKWTPSIHMPRWASRITLEITSVRVERLQDISEADAQAEGVEDVTAQVAPRDPEFRFWRRYRDGGLNGYTGNAIASYASLWTEINGPGSWDANPWVWAIEFRRLA